MSQNNLIFIIIIFVANLIPSRANQIEDSICLYVAAPSDVLISTTFVKCLNLWT